MERRAEGRLLIQMHGESGAGKSTVARLLGHELSAVVLDKDLLKNPGHLLGLTSDVSGEYAYDALFALAGDILAQDYSVILDSPTFWPRIEQRGRALADEIGATWLMVEVRCDDASEHRRRLASRDALPWQPREPRSTPLPDGAAEPACERIVIDTLQPLDVVVAEAVDAIRVVNEPRRE